MRPLSLGFSGSPLVVNNVPVAIFQRIDESLPGSPGIATRIDRIVEQIASPDLNYALTSPNLAIALDKQIESPSKLYGYNSTHRVREGVPADGKSYKYTPLGCDWRLTITGDFLCSIWIEADGDLQMSRMTNRPRLEMADGGLVPAATVSLTSDETGPGYEGKELRSFDFSNNTLKGLFVEAELARKSFLLQIRFPTKDVVHARAVLFSLGANDQIKRIQIIPPQ